MLDAWDTRTEPKLVQMSSSGAKGTSAWIDRQRNISGAILLDGDFGELENDIEQMWGIIRQMTDQKPTDVSRQVTISRGGMRYSRATRRFVQQVTLRNTGNTTLSGPFSLVVDGLTNGVRLFNRTAMTTDLAPKGRPYFNINPQNNRLTAGASITVTLEFEAPTNVGINYRPLLFSGFGSR